MERIKQALDRARSGAAVTVKKVSSKPGESGAINNDSHLFDYTQTRRLEFSSNYLENNRIISGPDDPVVEHYKVLRTRIIQRMNAHGWRSIGVTSPTEGVGKTLTAINWRLVSLGS